MAQVDHDLTTVNCFDQQLRLIKNLGRHNNRQVERCRDEPQPETHRDEHDLHPPPQMSYPNGPF
jgi:hypothetical protein